MATTLATFHAPSPATSEATKRTDGSPEAAAARQPTLMDSLLCGLEASWADLLDAINCGFEGKAFATTDPAGTFSSWLIDDS